MTVVYDSLTRQDAARCAELEAQLFDGDDPWPARAFLAELEAKHIRYVAARADDKLVGYAGISRLGRKRPYEYEIHTIGVDPAYQGQGIGRRMMTELLEYASGGTVFLEVRTDNDSRDRAVRESGLRQRRPAPSVLPVQRRRRLHDETGSAMTTILAIESSCDETGVGIAHLDDDGTVTLLADEVASSVDEHARFGGVVPEIASRAHLEALGPTMRRALAKANVGQARHRRRHHRSRAGRCAVGGSGCRQSIFGRLAGALLCRQPPRGSSGRRRLRPRPAAREHRPAGVRRAHQPAARAVAGRTDRRTRQHRRRRCRRGLRQGRAAARPRVSRRQGARRPGAPGRPRRDRLPARHDRASRRSVRVQLLRAQDRGGALRGKSIPTPRRQTSPPASRRPSPTC